MNDNRSIEVIVGIVLDHAILLKQIQNGSQHVVPIGSSFRCLEIDVQIRVFQVEIPVLAGDLHG